jgi:hypothetical protein
MFNYTPLQIMKNYTICVDYAPAKGDAVRIYSATNVPLGGAKPLGEWLTKKFPLYDWHLHNGQDREATEYCLYAAIPEIDEVIYASINEDIEV